VESIVSVQVAVELDTAGRNRVIPAFEDERKIDAMGP
jgi:hypothetical protein